MAVADAVVGAEVVRHGLVGALDVPAAGAVVVAVAADALADVVLEAQLQELRKRRSIFFPDVLRILYCTAHACLVLGIIAGLHGAQVVLPVVAALERRRAVVVDEHLVLAAAHLTLEVGHVMEHGGLRGGDGGLAIWQDVTAETGTLRRRTL